MSPLTPYDGRARLPLRKVNHEDAEPFYVVITKIFGFLMRRTTRQDWGPPDLPATGGVIVCPNHIANFDPPAVGHFVMWSGRFPHFLSKVEVFRIRGDLAEGSEPGAQPGLVEQAAELAACAQNCMPAARAYATTVPKASCWRQVQAASVSAHEKWVYMPSSRTAGRAAIRSMRRTALAGETPMRPMPVSIFR